MKRLAVLGIVLGLGAAGIAAGRQASPPQTQTADIQKVKDNLYVITGGGGNTAAFVTSTGVVLVDTKLANWGQAILDKVRTVTDRPVTMIINTHTHGDHVGSNEFFPTTVDIVAHANTKASMTRMPAFAGDKEQFLPKRTFTDKMSLLSGSDRIDLYHFGRGHTNGDAIIVFAALGTAHTGDLFAYPRTPIIDTNNGGSGVEYPKTVAKVAAGIPGVDTVIPGHSGVTTWSAVGEYADFMAAIVSAVEAGKKAGLAADAIAASITLPDRFKAYGLDRLKQNVDTISGELE